MFEALSILNKEFGNRVGLEVHTTSTGAAITLDLFYQGELFRQGFIVSYGELTDGIPDIVNIKFQNAIKSLRSTIDNYDGGKSWNLKKENLETASDQEPTA